MKTILLIFYWTLAIGQCIGQTEPEFKPYIANEYSINKYSVILDNLLFLNYKIEIRQLHLEDHDSNDPSDFYCRGWLTVYKGEKIISKLYFPTIDAVGSCFGFFIPESQPRNDCFIISKIDGYNANLYIVDSLGNIEVLWGGSFYISNDNGLLFSNDASDLPSLTIYDLNRKITIYSDSLESDLSGHYLYEWYFARNEYYATIWNYDTNQIDTDLVALFNIKKQNISFVKRDTYTINDNLKLNYFDMVNPRNRCNCGR